MALGAFWFSAMSFFVKLAGQRIPPMQIVLVRAVITAVLSYALVRRAGVSAAGRRRPLLIIRGITGWAALTCFYFSLVHLPLGEATVIQYMNPVFAAILGALFLGERLGARDAAGILASMAGVVIIARPEIVFGGDHPIPPLYAVIAVGGALFSASSYVTVRKLRETDHPLVVVFYFTLISVPLALPLALAHWVWPSPAEWAVLVGVGLTTQLGQVYFTRGLQLEPAGRATAVGYLQIVFAALWGIVLLGERPDGWSVLGAAVIVGGTLLVALRSQRAIGETVGERASSPNPG
jgi:drug/metabolite transporter (DMT)-like permease